MTTPRVDGYLSRKAQAVYPSALVLESPGGEWILRRADAPDLGLGDTFRDARAALYAVLRAERNARLHGPAAQNANARD